MVIIIGGVATLWYIMVIVIGGVAMCVRVFPHFFPSYELYRKQHLMFSSLSLTGIVLLSVCFLADV